MPFGATNVPGRQCVAGHRKQFCDSQVGIKSMHQSSTIDEYVNNYNMIIPNTPPHTADTQIAAENNLLNACNVDSIKA